MCSDTHTPPPSPPEYTTCRPSAGSHPQNTIIISSALIHFKSSSPAQITNKFSIASYFTSTNPRRVHRCPFMTSRSCHREFCIWEFLSSENSRFDPPPPTHEFKRLHRGSERPLLLAEPIGPLSDDQRRFNVVDNMVS